MKECEVCGYSSEEEFSVCPQCEGKKTDSYPEQGFVKPIERQRNLYEYKSGGAPDVVDISVESSPAVKSLSSKGLKALAVCLGGLLVAFVVVLLVSKLMSPASDKGNNTSSVQQGVTDSNRETPHIEMKPTRYEMTGEFSDYQLKIDGNVYQIHMTVGEILDSGWIFTGGVSDGVIPAGEKAELLLKSADGAVMQVTAVNYGKADVSCRECVVSEMKVEEHNNTKSDIRIINDLKLGFCDVQSLENSIGECSSKALSGDGYVLTYRETETRIAQFTFHKDTEKLIGIRFCENEKPEGYGDDDYWDNANQTALPYPTDPSVTPTSGIISIDGEVYRLPISVEVLISRGWSAEFEGDKNEIPSGSIAYATFTRGSAVLTGVDVYNPTVSDAHIDDCAVVSVSSSSAEGWVVFPLGIKAGVSDAAFLLSVEGMDYEFDDTYYDEYVFSDDKYTFVVNIDSKTGKVIYISSSYNYR